MEIAPLLQDYMETVAGVQPRGQLKIYPGSPFVTQALLREEARDKLKLFEMHPTDSKALAANIAQLKAGRQVAVGAPGRLRGPEGLPAAALAARPGADRPQLRDQERLPESERAAYRTASSASPPAPTPSGIR